MSIEQVQHDQPTFDDNLIIAAQNKTWESIYKTI